MEVDVEHVGVREFKDNATTLLANGETLVVERHGKPVGFFIPIVANDRAKGKEALDRFGRLVEDLSLIHI